MQDEVGTGFPVLNLVLPLLLFLSMSAAVKGRKEVYEQGFI